MLLGLLSASLLGNILAIIRTIRTGNGSKGSLMKETGIIRAGYGSKGSLIKGFLAPPHLLNNFEIQKYY